MAPSSAIQVINAFVRGLQPTGAAGFEGLVALLIQEATGQEFRITSSGRQAGRDAASESGFANSIKIETKHYLETTRLDLRELIGEIDEAADSDPMLDIWVLAASRSVGEQIMAALDKQAEFRGIEVVLLDVGINELPRLAVLMAEFPATVRAWAGRLQMRYDADQLESALLVVGGEPDFASTKRRLFSKLNSTAGYEAARRRSHERFLKTLADLPQTRSAFRQSVAIRNPNSEIIHRTELSSALDAWWQEPPQPGPAVALGEEGTGKTWAVFDWAIARVERGDMPVILPFVAIAHAFTNGDSVESILPRLLAKWVGLLDEVRWKRRLERWLRASSTGRPLILLIIDGLNERADIDWRPFLATLMVEPWVEKVAILATDRPHHWRVRCSRAGLSPFYEIPVNGYSERELDRALSTKGLSHQDIPERLLPLVSIPRYCRLVANHYGEMIASGDFTRERLIYIDIRDRQLSKLQYPLTDAELFALIRALAAHARTNPELNPRDLKQLVSVPGGDEANIYEEIVSGGLLVPVLGLGGLESFKVEPLRLVYGFGMLLAAGLAKLSSAAPEENAEFLASWFEPHQDMDLKVDICGSAMFHALFDDHFPDTPLRELIRYWLGLRNWADTAQFAFASYVIRRPTIFLDLAEYFWSSLNDSGAAQEFLGAALRTHRDEPNLQLALIAAIERWMGFVHPLGRQHWRFDSERKHMLQRSSESASGQEALRTNEEAGKEESVRQEIQARAGCPVVAGEIEVAGSRLTVVSDGDLLRLARLGLMLMSAGDPTPFISSIATWAVASAVMNESDLSELVSWVIRLSDETVDSVLAERARLLLTRNTSTARQAARTLLFALGTPESESLVEEHDLTPEWYKKQRAQHRSDPCRSGYEWADSEVFPCLSREDVPLHVILDRAALHVVDPSISLPASLVLRANAALDLVDPAAVRAASSRTIELHHLEVVTNILCAHAPQSIARFMRAVVRSIPGRDLTGQYYLAIHLPELALLLGSQEVKAVSTALASLSVDAYEWSTQDGGPRQMRRGAEARAFSAIAPHLSPTELFRTMMARPSRADDLIGFEPWFAPISEEIAKEAISLLHAPPNEQSLYRLLWMLPHLGITLSVRDRDRLVSLAGSGDAKARAGATRVAVVSKDEDLGRRIVDLGIRADKETDPWEEKWLTLALAHFGRNLSFEALATRLRPSTLSFSIAKRGNSADELDMYADCLGQEWQRIVSADDADSEFLPSITVNNDLNHAGLPFPELNEPDRSRPLRLERSNSWTLGPPLATDAELQEFFSVNDDKRIRQLNEDRGRKVEAILAAWRTDAFRWYGRIFSFETLDRLYERHPSRVDRWVEPALADSPAGCRIRIRLGGFLEPICQVLLSRNPQAGLRLWKMLRKRANTPLVFETVEMAFATDSMESNVARRIVLDECWNDTAIAQLALACTEWRRQSWLEQTISELFNAERPWKTAKALTLASFSDITPEYFEELVSRAAIEGTWIEQIVPRCRQNVRKNHLARHWYRVFLCSDNSDAAWGALQLVLAYADERLLAWCEEIEEECKDNGLSERRIRFLGLGWYGRRDVRKELNRDSDRRDKLFGLKIQPGEIVPFMPTDV